MSSGFGKVVEAYYRANLTVSKILSGAEVSNHPLSKELEEQGIIMIPGAISKEEVDSINHMNTRYFTPPNFQELVVSPDGIALSEASKVSKEEFEKFYFLHIKNYQHKFDIFRDIMPQVDPILRGYYRSHYSIRDLFCYRTQPIAKVQGSYQWHTDNYPPGCLKVMVYLTDVDADSGPLAYAKTSHLRHSFNAGSIGKRYNEEEVKKEFDIFRCIGPRGSIIIFNNNGIHRASDPKNGMRDVINFTVFPSIRKARKEWVKGLDLKTANSFLKKYTR